MGFCLHRVKHLGVKKLVVLTNLLKFFQMLKNFITGIGYGGMQAAKAVAVLPKLF